MQYQKVEQVYYCGSIACNLRSLVYGLKMPLQVIIKLQIEIMQRGEMIKYAWNIKLNYI